MDWDSDLGEASWFSNLGEARPVGSTRVVGSDGTVSIVESLSLSPRVEKPKSQEGNKSFVPELPRVVSVSGFPMYISHIRTLVVFLALC